MHTNILSYKNGRYLGVALLTAVASIVLYLSQDGGSQPPNGGTWQGYVLGTVGALLIVWLTLLGVRKRRYSSSIGTVQGWTSAHVYLGGILLLVATLHSAGQLGWNVHTLAYALMTIVILSGFYGIFVYFYFPRVMAGNRVDLPREHWLKELAGLDEAAQQECGNCDADVQEMVVSALGQTRFGGGVWAQLRAKDSSQMILPPPEGSGGLVSNQDQQRMIDQLAARIPKSHKKTEAAALNALLGVFGRRQKVLAIIRRDVQIQGLLQIWLYFHVPATIALLAALSIHILSVFIYW